MLLKALRFFYNYLNIRSKKYFSHYKKLSVQTLKALHMNLSSLQIEESYWQKKLLKPSSAVVLRMAQMLTLLPIHFVDAVDHSVVQMTLSFSKLKNSYRRPLTL